MCLDFEMDLNVSFFLAVQLARAKSERLSCLAVTGQSQNVDTHSGRLSHDKGFAAGVQRIPYLSVAHWHEGQTDAEDKHPCCLHLGLAVFLMAVPTFLSVLLYLPALTSMLIIAVSRQRELGRKKEKHAPYSGVFPTRPWRDSRRFNLIRKLERWYEETVLRIWISFVKLGATHFVFTTRQLLPSSTLEIKAPWWNNVMGTVPHHTVVPYYRRYYITTFCPSLTRQIQGQITGLDVLCTTLFYCDYV